MKTFEDALRETIGEPNKGNPNRERVEANLKSFSNDIQDVSLYSDWLKGIVAPMLNNELGKIGLEMLNGKHDRDCPCGLVAIQTALHSVFLYGLLVGMNMEKSE